MIATNDACFYAVYPRDHSSNTDSEIDILFNFYKVVAALKRECLLLHHLTLQTKFRDDKIVSTDKLISKAR